MTTVPLASKTVNVAARLTTMAEAMPDAVAVVEPLGYDRGRRRRYRQVTFRELDQDSDRIARGLRELGVVPGTRLALLVRPGIDFISLVFALFKAGAVAILIDPGMGRRNLIQCLVDARPEGFVAIPMVHAVRALLRGRFARARFNVTVGRRWFWGGVTLSQLRRSPHDGVELTPTKADDPAAIIFTTGSTGPPKGVLYRHGNFDAQVDQIRDFYGIQPGEVDLPGFPLFGLFNCAMGVTTVVPDMDPSRPAQVDPAKIVEAIHDWKVTQTFGSPAIWKRVGDYCQQQGIRLPSLRRVLSAGAPVPADVLGRMKACIHPQGEIHTPYGATEALPVSSISASEVLGETAEKTRQGAGVCVGRRFSGIRWKVIRIVDGPIASLVEAEQRPAGKIGELIVQGPVVTREYCTRIETRVQGSGFRVQDFARIPSCARHEGREPRTLTPEPQTPSVAKMRPLLSTLGKIPDGDQVWHRMGDVGYLDELDRFWICGRLAHRVLTPDGPMFTIPCEAIFNEHPDIYRSALVGLGPPDHSVGHAEHAPPMGWQRPVIVLEPEKGRLPRTVEATNALLCEVRRLGRENPRTERIEHFLLHPAFPVDLRHNAKIFREKLAVWAEEQLPEATPSQ